MAFFLLWRKPRDSTLADELRRMEEEAKAARAASSLPYSRALLAKESGVTEDTLAAWLDRGRSARDQGKLPEVIRVLSAWASQDGAVAKSGKSKHWTRRGSVWIMGIAVTALVSGVIAAIIGDVNNVVTSGPTPPAGSASAAADAEDLQAQADWCCKFTSIIASTGYYWSGSAASLFTALRTPSSGVTSSSLAPAGLAVIEIPVQTSGTEPIYVAPPKVIVRSRAKSLVRGMIAILPRGGQGSGAPGQYEADVDDATPDTVPYGAASDQSTSYQYVSSGSPETITLYVADSDYDCTFDIRLTWLEQGHTHTMLLTNGGRHFRILGSSGLPWYKGDPQFGVTFSRVFGHPFSYYAPGSS